MKFDRLVSAVKKLGYEIKIHTWNSLHYYVETDKRILEWYKQDDAAICVNSKRRNDHHDILSDYSAGYFCKTIKQAVASLGE